MLNVCLLGCGGHTPLPYRRLTSLLINYTDYANSILIDCGEGTQVALVEGGWKLYDIKVICLTHLHADHTAGLPGLLASMSNLGRTAPLTIIGVKGTRKLMDAIYGICGYIDFDVKVIEVCDSNRSFMMFPFKIEMQKVFHSTICYAYKITALRRRKCLPERANSNKVPVEIWDELLEKDYTYYKGKKYSSNLISEKRRKGIVVSYCTDTRPTSRLPKFVSGSDLLVAEGMYYNEYLSSAKKFKHMTYAEAAQVALEGGVKELWLTHFSPSIVKPKDYLGEALHIFKNTQIGVDGKHKVLMFED